MALPESPAPSPAARPDASDAQWGTSVAPDATDVPQDTGRPDVRTRRRVTAEIWIVLGLSLGQSAVYAVVSLVAKLTAGPPLASQSTALNVSQSPRPLLDLTYQLLSLLFAVIPVALALYLLTERGRSGARRIGLTKDRPWRDLGVGVALAASIGIPGLAFYAVGRALGITVQVQASALNAHWWTIPVLVLSALQNGLLEEVVAVGYVSEKLAQLKWRGPLVVATSALLRGSYHLYQGWGPFVGNAIMGVVFAWYYQRTRRVAPLVVAHFLMDMVVFVGYDLIPHEWLATLGLN